MRAPTLLFFGFVLAACSSPPQDSTGDAAPDAARDATIKDGGTVLDDASTTITCEAGVYVGHVTGTVLDQNGAPPTSPIISICGDACINGKLAADGTFTIAPHFCYVPNAFYSTPVFLYHGEPDYAYFAVDFLPPAPAWVDDASIPWTMHTWSTAGFARVAYDPTAPLSLSDGKGFSLTAAAGALHPTIQPAEVMAGGVDPAFFPLAPDAGQLALTAVYVIVPAGTYVTPPATVRFPNVANLAPGTLVDLVGIGDLATPQVAPGTLGVVGSGRVSTDGTSVESVPGTDSGLGMLGWVGYRPKP